MREEGTSSEEWMGPVPSELFEPVQEFLRDQCRSEFSNGLVVVALRSSAQLNVLDYTKNLAHIPRALPSASTPPSTSNGVIFCSLAAWASGTLGGKADSSGIVGDLTA